MAARLIESLWVTGYGASAASGKVYFYAPGTLTQITVYSDDATTHAITQPVTLDANGRSTVPVYVTVPARAIIQDVNGVTLEDIERIDGDRAALVALVNTKWPSAASEDAAWTLLGQSLGGTDGNIRAMGAGAQNRTLQAKLADSLSAKDFGAKGDGVTDDTAAINAALASLTAPGASVYLSPGIYLTSAPIVVSVAGTTLYGAGPAASIIKNTNTASSAVTIANVTGVTLTMFGIAHASSSTASGIAQSSASSHDYSFLDVTGHRTGLSGLQGRALWVSVATDNNAAGVHMDVTGDADILFCRFTATLNSIGIRIGVLVNRLQIVGCAIPQTVGTGAIAFTSPSALTSATVAFNTIGSPSGQSAIVANTTQVLGLRMFSNTGQWFWSSTVSSFVTVTPAAGVATLDLSQGQNFQVSFAAAVAINFQIGPSAIATRVHHPDDRITVLMQNTSGGGITPTAGSANVIAPTGGFGIVAATAQRIYVFTQQNNSAAAGGKLVTVSIGTDMAITT